MNFKKRLVTAIATGAVLLNSVAPIAFAQDITVTGNGSDSHNNVDVSTNNTAVVNQNNTLNVTNNVNSNASSGGNSSSHNTGGNVDVTTGAASTTTNVSTTANLNMADVNNCQCNNGGTNVTVDGNGDKSHTYVDVNQNSGVTLNQTNNSTVKNDVDSKASTGGNDANHNTGGSVDVTTGAASTNTSVNNVLNGNVAKIGGGTGTGNGSSVTVTGNGDDSHNKVDLDRDSTVVLNQTNSAYVNNDVDAKASTGNNDVKHNTGGNVSVDTGKATTNTDVTNMVNFNAADVDCSCLVGSVDVKVAKNGDDSHNKVNSDTSNGLWVGDVNGANLYNDVDGNAKSGNNDVNFNTGNPGGDPSVTTGAAGSTNDVSNGGNVNLYNQGVTFHLPGGSDLQGTLDFSVIWALLVSHLTV